MCLYIYIYISYHTNMGLLLGIAVQKGELGKHTYIPQVRRFRFCRSRAGGQGSRAPQTERWSRDRCGHGGNPVSDGRDDWDEKVDTGMKTNPSEPPSMYGDRLGQGVRPNSTYSLP